MKKAIRAVLPASVPWLTLRLAERLDPYVQLSYSQDGEDMVLRRLLGGQRSGFYVDVGAHHPFRFSNTCYFHRLGWRGINIDADPDAMALFGTGASRRYQHLHGIGETEGELVFIASPSRLSIPSTPTSQRKDWPYPAFARSKRGPCGFAGLRTCLVKRCLRKPRSISFRSMSRGWTSR